ncbi:MAG: NAD-dependent epimerase/dehydratase family protein [Bacteroidota bacterium]
MNVAVIGSNGFIGSHLTQKLSQVPHISIFLFGRNEFSIFKNKYPYTQLNLSDTNQIKDNFKNIDVVYYLASATIPSSSWEDPTSELEKNLLPFMIFTECVSKLNVKKIIFVSSAGTIYGPSSEKVFEYSDKQPFSPYGIIKLTIEHFLNYFKAKYNINYDIFRVSNVYGEGQDTSKGLGIINTFIENILSKGEIQIFGNGENTRNYVYVKDVADLLYFSLLSNINESNIYNVASNDTISINQLISILNQVIKEDFKITYTRKRQSDNSFIDLDNTKILKSNPDFKFTNIKDGITQTYNYIKSNKFQ